MTEGLVPVELRQPRGYLQPVVLPWPAARLPAVGDVVTVHTYAGRETWRVGRLPGWEVRDTYDQARGRRGPLEAVLVVELV